MQEELPNSFTFGKDKAEQRLTKTDDIDREVTPKRDTSSVNTTDLISEDQRENFNTRPGHKRNTSLETNNTGQTYEMPNDMVSPKFQMPGVAPIKID